jgi:hypothetical protein
MRTFTIHGSNGKSTTLTGSYKVFDNGALGVKPDDGKPFVMSPSGWVQLDVDDAPTVEEILYQG